jgi:hypothetical protein
MSFVLRIIKFSWLTLCCAAFYQNAYAVDGVLEINQICAVQTGCFPGDIAGFPVTITAATPGGSFRLTGELTIDSAAVTAIQVQSSDVVIDLNGFAISGPVTCTGDRPSCAGGAGDGVSATSAFQEITVRNGTIRGMGRFGVNLPAFSRVEQLQIVSNGGSAISGGVNVLEGSIVRNNLINNNGGDGIHTTEAPMITDNIIYNNRDDGIDTVDNNNNDEIGGGMISGNLVRGNGASTNFNLRLDATAAYQNNVITTDPDDPAGPGFVTGGINMGGNFCGTAACP